MSFLNLPETHIQCYISGIPALNIISPEGTGDWHSSSALAAIHGGHYPTKNYLFGDGQYYSTNHLLGTKGVIDGKSRLDSMGYPTAHEQVWIADHPRACVDYLYITVLQSGVTNLLMLDDWFPSYEDKCRVYDLINIIAARLSDQKQEVLKKWMQNNLLITF